MPGSKVGFLVYITYIIICTYINSFLCEENPTPDGFEGRIPKRSRKQSLQSYVLFLDMGEKEEIVPTKVNITLFTMPDRSTIQEVSHSSS